VIGLAGSLSGILLCVVVLFIASRWMLGEHGILIAPQLDPRSTVLVAMATTLLAALAGLAPAVLAYRTSVARNLRPLG